MQDKNIPQVLIHPLRPALIEGVDQKLSVLVRVQAPDTDAGTQKARKPYHLSLVIDRSGSMSGKPLSEALRCARHVVDRLAPTDRASLVVFDDKVKTLVAAKPIGDRSALHAALARIHTGGSTDLCGGWQAGVDTLLPDAGEAALARVILLSDGNANAGELTETSEIAALCARALASGVTTSTYGLGRSFNEELMVEMAKLGAGNHYYGDTADDLLEPFAEEFDFISNLFARQVRLALGAPHGVKLTVLNDYPMEAREGFSAIRLPDIALGAEAWVVIELEIPASLATGAATQLLQAGVTASTPEGLPVVMHDATLVLPALSPAAWDALLPDALVLARLAELEAGRLLEQARAAAEQGDTAAIARLIAQARARFADHPWVLEVIEGLAELAEAGDMARFSKESLYSSRKMRSRLSAKSELLQSLSAEDASASYLRRKRAQGKAQFDRKPEDGSDPQ